MKKILSLLLIACVLLSMTACADDLGAAEEALNAVKKMDLDTFVSCMTSNADMSRLLANYDMLDEEEKQTLIRLYGEIRYTLEADKDLTLANGSVVRTFNVKIPDIARVRTLANAQIVFGKTANEAVAEIIDRENVDMRSVTWQILMQKENGEWRVAAIGNDAWIKDLGLSELIAFFAKY